MDNSLIPDSDGDLTPAVRMEEENAPERVGAAFMPSPYDAFNVKDGDRDSVVQVEALLADPEIAGYIKGNADTAWNRRRIAQCAIGFVVTAACLATLIFFLPGNMLRSYRPPAPQDNPKPQAYADMSTLPILYREGIREINDDIAAGNRWKGAFEKLRAFIGDMDAGKIDPPEELRVWAYQEMLVILASKEIPPDAYADDYPDAINRKLDNALVVTSAPVPFRAGAAYARVLASRPTPKDEAGARSRREGLIDVLERLREENPELLDKNRNLLTIEAEQHILQFPPEYSADNRYLDYHWRRSAHAILRLYDMYGKRDAGVRQIDKQRWQAVLRYFDFTLFTLDTKRLGRLKSIRLDGSDYTREQVRAELEAL